MDMQDTGLPSNHLAVVERAHRQIFCSQLYEHRYNRICLYEKNSLLVNAALPLLGKLVGHFSVPTPTTIMVCDVALALLNHQIKRGTLPLTRNAPFSTQPIADFIQRHGGTHLSFNTILCILEHGMAELLANLEKNRMVILCVSPHDKNPLTVEPYGSSLTEFSFSTLWSPNRYR